MKKKFLGRVLTMLLVASMVFTLLPASAIAAGNWWWNADEYTEEAAPAATADNSDYQYNIFFLDCGRKYFSVDSIKTLINNASAAGFNYIQLAVGNDGLRLLLDDMSLEVNGTTYTTEQVSAAIQAGNLAYNAGIVKDNNHEAYNPEKNELTQSDMNTIIAHAKSKGMGVIPCVNTPGHMDAILSAATSLTKTTCAYNSSKTTIDVTNTTATDFTKALLQKYITYFKSQGCQLFNMGADEYANDVYKTGGMGFAHLKTMGQYVYYVNYINAVATMIKDAGMTPLAFNDGIYYGGDTSTAINKSIVICYWSSGWSGYEVRSAKNLVNDGFAMINTHGDYYYVLGKPDKYDEFGTSYASGFNRYNFIDGSTIQQPVGSMLCVWCDYPGDEDEATILSNTPDIIKNFGSTLPKLNTTPVQPDTGITITPEGGTTGTPKLDSAAGQSIVLDAGKVVTWSYDPALVTLTSADAPSEVALAELATLSARRVTVTPVAGASGTATITAADENGNRDTFPIEVVNSSAPTDVTVDLKVDQTSDPYTVDGDVTAANMTFADNFDAVASYKLTPKPATGETVVTEPLGKTFYIKSEDGKYLDATANWQKGIQNAAQWIGRTSGSSARPYCLELANSSPASYIYKKPNNNWALTNDSNTRGKFVLKDGSKLQIAGITLGTPVQTSTGSSTAYTDITFTGVGEGTTHVTIGGTKYTINVSYYEQPVNVVLNQSTPVTVSGALNKKELNESVATVSISADGKTMTVTGVAEGNTSVIVGNTKYLITVSKEDLEAVTPLKIEYWITNGRAQHSAANAAQELTVKATVNGMTTEGGVAVTAEGMVPNPARRSSRNVDYWQCRLLDKDAEGWQTDDNGIDQTESGVAFTKVRYFGGHWAVYTEKNKWVNIESNHQLVAYFLEHIQVTDEVDSRAADWGKKGDGTPYNEYLDPSNVNALSFQVVYEDGNTNPSGTTAEDLASKTICYGYWPDGRGIGTVMLDETLGYEIYKVTAETGALTGSGSTWEGYTVESFTWDKNEITVWEGESNGRVILHNNARVPEREGKYANLMWDENEESILLRIYVRAKATPDSLYVHYIDMTDNDNEFYSYPINVKQGTTFSPEFNLSSEKNVLVGNEVLNSANVNQKVTAELKNMTEIGAQYRYADYECKRVDKDAALKNVYLYYTFSRKATFVADFGLPIEIPLEQINDNLKTATITKVEVQGTAFGNATVSNDMKSITYTPSKVFGTETESFSVNVTGNIVVDGTAQTGTVGYRVYVLPASNVLYEASFLTQVSKDNGPAWTAPTATTTRKQQTQKVGDTTTDYNVFGRDTAYDNAYGPLGAWTASGLDFKSSTRALTTNFYGNGFDLIGNCGPKTGRVILFVKNPETGKGKLVDVDTRYGADTFYQVPLAHVMMAEEASYSVTVYAAGLKATNAPPASYSLRGAATYASDYAADSYDAVLNGVLAENGLTMADVEYVKVESAPAAAKTARRATSFYALDTAAETGPVTHEAGDHVEIDGFRVYRSKNNTNYPESEQNVQYLNILDAVSSFTAFVEGSTADRKWEARDQYENAGGPQNEIYLRKTDGTGNAIAFKVNPNASVQISARAVENKKAATLVVNDTETVIATNTEMYYTFTAGADGIVTIKNTGEGMLALGNLKIKNGTQAAALNEEDYPAAIALLSLNAAPETPDTVFEPTISAKVTTTRFIRSKVVTLTVSASADVAKLTVNGTELRPTNGWLVSMGWSKSYNYILTETVKKSETKTYEIIGYSADGTASTPTVVKSK